MNWARVTTVRASRSRAGLPERLSNRTRSASAQPYVMAVSTHSKLMTVPMMAGGHDKPT